MGIFNFGSAVVFFLIRFIFRDCQLALYLTPIYIRSDRCLLVLNAHTYTHTNDRATELNWSNKHKKMCKVNVKWRRIDAIQHSIGYIEWYNHIGYIIAHCIRVHMDMCFNDHIQQNTHDMLIYSDSMTYRQAAMMQILHGKWDTKNDKITMAIQCNNILYYTLPVSRITRNRANTNMYTYVLLVAISDIIAQTPSFIISIEFDDEQYK